MMNATDNRARLVDDLSASWTDSVLDMLSTSGVHGASVSMELETWKSLKDVINLTVRRQQSLPFSPVSADDFMKQVLLLAMLRVARRFAPALDTFGLEYRLRPWVQLQNLTLSDCRLYLRLVRSETNGKAMSTS